LLLLPLRAAKVARESLAKMTRFTSSGSVAQLADEEVLWVEIRKKKRTNKNKTITTPPIVSMTVVLPQPFRHSCADAPPPF
jgi:hypothetical protein